MMKPTVPKTRTNPIDTAADTFETRRTRFAAGTSRSSLATKPPRYAGSSENPHGLNVATIPALNASATVELIIAVTSSTKRTT